MRDKARRFAIKAHGSQKYGAKPYSVHLDAVACIVESFGVQAQVIAFLHDVVEDTDTTVPEIAAVFGLFVAQCADTNG